MTKIIVVPGQNVFNRNYKGSSCYCRYNSVIIRQKRIPKRDVLSTVSITRSFLKKSSSLWPTLNTEEKQTFIDYASSNPKYKSGLNVMAGINIASAYTNQLCFTLIRSIGEAPVAPEIPWIHTVIVSYPNKKFRVVLDTEYATPVKIRIHYCLKNSGWFGESDVFTYLNYFWSDISYKEISWAPYIGYSFMFIRCTSLGDSKIESVKGNFDWICPV